MSAAGAAAADAVDPGVLAYVRAAAAALAVPLDEAQAQRVAVHLARTAALARQLERSRMTPADEPASVYCPSPFPSSPPSRGSPSLPPADGEEAR